MRISICAGNMIFQNSIKINSQIINNKQMLINNLQNHKQKYSEARSYSLKTDKSRKLDSSYYDKYLDSHRKTQKQFCSSPYLKSQQNPIHYKTSMKQLKNQTRQTSSLQLMNNKLNTTNLKKNKNKNSGSKFFGGHEPHFTEYNNCINNKLDIVTMKTEDLPASNSTRIKFKPANVKYQNNYYCTKTQLKNWKFNKLGAKDQHSIMRKQTPYQITNGLKSEELIKTKSSKISFLNQQNRGGHQQSNAEREKKLIQPTINESQLQFLRNLKFNQVFFCPMCFRYIFAVQKYLHFPKCQSKLDLENLPDEQKQNIGLGRLKVIQQLIDYTKLKNNNLEKTIELMKNKQYRKDKEYDEPRYLSIQEIDKALFMIYSQLILNQSLKRGKTEHNFEKISCKNLKVKNS